MSETPTMKIRALAPWFGGKRTLAPRIVQELGKQTAYFEVCAGSMAVLLAKAPAAMEVVNDLHGDLINLARVIASDRYAELAARLDRALMHDDLFLEAKAECADGDGYVAPSVREVGARHVERAFWYFIYSWMGRNGVSGTAASNITVAARYTSNGGSGSLRFRSAVESVPAWHDRLKAVQIRRGDAIEMAERVEDAPGTVIYADPPYIEKGAKYLHDFAEEDHARLAAALTAKRRTRVVVSYYEHPTVRALYPGWTVVECPFTKGLANQGARGAKGPTVAPEILLINGPSLTAGGLWS